MSRHGRRHPVPPREISPLEPLVSTPSISAPTHQWSPLLQRIIIWLFHILLIVTPLVFTWVNEELFEFNKMMFTYGAAALIGSAWIMRMVVEQRWIIRRTVFDIPLLLFLASQVLSTIFSIDPYTSVFGYYTRFHGGLLSTLTYILLYYAFVTNVPVKHLPRLFLSLSLAALGSALYAIPEHFGHSPSCWLISDGQAFDVSCWVQDVKSRVFGTFGQPNWLAAYSVTIIPVLMALTSTSWLKKGLYWLTGAALFATLLFTQSRSGQLGLIVGLGVFGLGWLWLVIRKQLSLREGVTQLAPWLVGLAVLVGVFGSAVSADLFTLMKSGSSVAPVSSSVEATPANQPVVNRLDEGGTNSGEIRKIVWEGAVAVARRYPLLGSGVETFAYSYYQDRPTAHNLVSEWDFLYNKAHNEFLNFWATTGILGLASYCLILGWFGWQTVIFLLKAKNNSSTSLLVIGLASGLVALSVSNFFGFSTVMVSILLFWYLGIFELVTRPQVEEKAAATATVGTRSNDKALSSNQYIGLGLTALVGLYALWSVVTMWTADFNYARGKQLLLSGYTNEGLDHLVAAVQQAPHEALFYDELATTYSALAVQLARQNDATSAAQFAESAIATSQKTLELNPRHLNFHKSQARIYITLAELQPAFLNQAVESLIKAIELSPTDAKLVYNLALVQLALGQTEAGVQSLEKTIALKSNYEAARVELAQYYISQERLREAQDQYVYILEKITPGNQLVQEKLKAVEASISAQKGRP
jgi:putative inorganic carbon (HCO3(-)) transporter